MAEMWISMQLAWAVVAVVAAAVPGLPETDGAGPLRRIDAIPMAWRIDRESGAASGHKSCSVISLGGDVTARLSKDRRAKTAAWSVTVGFDNQPGSLRYLRINKTIYQTDKDSFRGSEAAEIVARLKSPGEFAFEWAKRPDYVKRPGLFGTGGFAAKAAECERWMKGTRV